jgi:uncharacterized membrane protein YesL
MKGPKTRKRIFEGGIHLWMEKFFDAVILNILWLFCCLPLVTAGAASTAFYYTAVKVLRRERGHLVAEFWHSFKLNFVKAGTLWIVFAVVFFILFVNRNIALEAIGGYFGLFLACLYVFLAAAAFAIMLYAFPVLSRFNMSLVGVFKLSVYMVFRYLPSTLAIMALWGAAAFILFRIPLLLPILPSGVLIASSYFIERILIRHTPLPVEGAEYKWYLEVH